MLIISFGLRLNQFITINEQINLWQPMTIPLHVNALSQTFPQSFIQLNHNTRSLQKAIHVVLPKLESARWKNSCNNEPRFRILAETRHTAVPCARTCCSNQL